MPTHKKSLPKIMRKRRRYEKRKRLIKKGVNPDELFKSGVYIGERKSKTEA